MLGIAFMISCITGACVNLQVKSTTNDIPKGMSISKNDVMMM